MCTRRPDTRMANGMRASLLALAGLLLTAGVAAAADQATLRLDWTVYGYHAAFYWALDKGYYREQGVDLKINEGQGSGKTVQIVASGAEEIGFADFAAMAKGMGQGMSLKAIYGYMQRSVWGVITWSKDNIRAPKDLIGKSMGVSPGTRPLFNPFLEANGLGAGQVREVSVSEAVRNQAFLQHKFDTIMTTIVGSGYLLKYQEGDKIHILPFYDWGLDMLAHGLFVTTKTLQEKPDLLKRVLRAVTQGVVAGRERPEEAIALLVKRFPALRGKEEMYLGMYRVSWAHVQTPASRGKPIGWMAKEDWTRTQDILVKTGDVKKALPVETYYTNDLVPQ
ncbi:MAG: ABC transporter substrate-binding protein [Deltaproteobacteria bacterium]|nr:ABC transporter substrate-binding protein [Deltaproteobacteria bacterium]MBI3075628.1 ABC transporter substrate-binding protein [Deltaproteobacteria bacterium]